MYCMYCGKEIPDDCAFCIECGADLREPAAKNPKPEPPVYSYQPQQPHVQPQQPYVQPSYVTESAAAKNRPVNKRVWPSACGVMGVLAFCFYITAFAISLIFGGNSLFLGQQTVLPIIFILMAVGFFVHTRDVPWVTMFPFLFLVIYLLYSNLGFLSVLGHIRLSGWQNLSLLISVLIPVLLFIFYLLIVLIRPGNAALRVLYTVFMSIEIVVLVVTLFSSIEYQLFNAPGFYITNIVLIRISYIFFYIGYCVAASSVRPRSK